MSVETTVAIIVAGLALLGTIVTFFMSARKNELDILRGIIKELKDYVEELEIDKEDLETWAEALVCQAKDAGLMPVKFVRANRKTKPRDKV